MNMHPLIRLANLFTLFRLILTIPFILFFHAKKMEYAAIFFGLAAVTDFVDGKIARKQGVTSFGSFMDSLVDKILVGAALISLYLFQHENLGNEMGLIPVWMVLVILGREVIVTGFRILFLKKRGEVISANRWGKYKTASQLTVITISLVLLIFLGDSENVVRLHGPIYFMMYVPLILTVASGLEFFYGNRKAFSV